MESSRNNDDEPYDSTVDGAIVATPTDSDPYNLTNDFGLYGNEEDAPTPETITPSPSSTRTRTFKLVRLESLPAEAHSQYIEKFRRARLLFASLRMSAEEKNYMPNAPIVPNTYLIAAKKMREMKLFRQQPIGHIPGLEVGDIFFYRAELSVLGVHWPHDAGIDFVAGRKTKTSQGQPTATSIVFSGACKTDRDDGETIYYTGDGGKKQRKSDHVRDQTLEDGGNMALYCNFRKKIHVRVIRQLKTTSGGLFWVYDGLYTVSSREFVTEPDSGFKLLVFTLLRKENRPPMGSSVIEDAKKLRSLKLEELPDHYFKEDLANDEETPIVYVHNEVDECREPFGYTYLATTDFPPHVHDSPDEIGCPCHAACVENACPCAKKDGTLFAYDQDGILFRGRPYIFECGPNCGCPHNCRNRVTQQGLVTRLVVFRKDSTSWGVRSLDTIQAGSFICEYAGVVKPEREWENGTCIYPARFPEKWKEWGDISAAYPDYAYPSSDLRLNWGMDVSERRNAASYIRHSSTPNVFVQLVFHEHKSASLPHVMLFALENIPPMRELTLDYGEARGDGSPPLEEAR